MIMDFSKISYSYESVSKLMEASLSSPTRDITLQFMFFFIDFCLLLEMIIVRCSSLTRSGWTYITLLCPARMRVGPWACWQFGSVLITYISTLGTITPLETFMLSYFGPFGTTMRSYSCIFLFLLAHAEYIYVNQSLGSIFENKAIFCWIADYYVVMVVFRVFHAFYLFRSIRFR